MFLRTLVFEFQKRSTKHFFPLKKIIIKNVQRKYKINELPDLISLILRNKFTRYFYNIHPKKFFSNEPN